MTSASPPPGTTFDKPSAPSPQPPSMESQTSQETSVLVPAGRLSNLPLELQIKIIHDAANSLDFLKNDRERRLMLVAFSLVSRAWLVEAQSRLYREIYLGDRGTESLRLLRFVLRTDLVKRYRLERLVLGDGDTECDLLIAWLQDLLGAVALPQLKHISSLRWKDEANERSPARRHHGSSPKLESLSVDLFILAEDLTLAHDWFDLSHLQTLNVLGPFNYVDESLGVLEQILDKIPSDLRHLSIKDFDSFILPNLTNKIKRFTSLQSLSLHPWLSGVSLKSDYLTSFSTLHHLSISYSDILPVLSAPHLNLTTLSIGNPLYDDPEPGQEALVDENGQSEGYSAMPGLHRKVNDVVRLIHQHPNRFPSLRLIAVKNWDEGFSFATKLGREVERESCKEMAAVLKEVGLALVDESGLEWNDE